MPRIVWRGRDNSLSRSKAWDLHVAQLTAKKEPMRRANRRIQPPSWPLFAPGANVGHADHI
jgi:hypothetical protein